MYLEFLVIGVVMGVIEDLIAVKVSTGASLTINVLLIVMIVAIPFAAFSELVVDRADFQFVPED